MQRKETMLQLPENPDVWTVIKAIPDSLEKEQVDDLLDSALKLHKFSKVNKESKEASDKRTLLMHAVVGGNIHCLDWLSSKGRLDIDDMWDRINKDSDGNTPLMLAVIHKKPKEVIEKLLGFVGYFGRFFDDQANALVQAIQIGHQEAVAVLAMQVKDLRLALEQLAISKVDIATKTKMAQSLCIGYFQGQYRWQYSCDYSKYILTLNAALGILLANKEVEVIKVLIFPNCDLKKFYKYYEYGVGNTQLCHQVLSAIVAYDKPNQYALVEYLLAHCNSDLDPTRAKAIEQTFAAHADWPKMREAIFEEALRRRDINMVVLLNNQSDIIEKILIAKPEFILQLFASKQSLQWKLYLLPLAKKAIAKEGCSQEHITALQKQINSVQTQNEVITPLMKIAQQLTEQNRQIKSLLQQHELAVTEGSVEDATDEYHAAVALIKTQIGNAVSMLKLTPAGFNTEPVSEEEKAVQPRAASIPPALPSFASSGQNLFPPSNTKVSYDETANADTLDHSSAQGAQGLEGDSSEKDYLLPKFD